MTHAYWVQNIADAIDLFLYYPARCIPTLVKINHV